MKALVFLTIFFSSLCFSQVDSSYLELSNNIYNIILKPRILLGTGFSISSEKSESSLQGVGNFNLRICSDQESWKNKNLDLLFEAGICYLTKPLVDSESNAIPYYFRLGLEVNLYQKILLSPTLGLVGVLNQGSEADEIAFGVGLSLNYTYQLTKHINLEFEGGTNFLPTGIITPYLVVGFSI